MPPDFFGDVTLLITHYNRSRSVERLLGALEHQNIRFADIVVSDDGSESQHLHYLRNLAATQHFTLVTSAQNQGLGNNINKGQDQVKTPLTLYIQEDFMPTAKFKKALVDSIEFMRVDPQLDLVRYFSNFQFPYIKPHKHEFSHIYIPAFALDYHKVYLYSDNPHLRRSTFLNKFGRYQENLSGDRTEYWMCISFIQKGGKALLHDDFKGIFKHINTDEEPSTMKRAVWKQRNNPLLSLARDTYRQLKYNFDIAFMKR